MKGNRGSVTIFLTILLVPMLIVSGVFVDVGRYQLAKAYVSNAADLTLRAKLANYDAALKETYGLYAVSQKEEETAYDTYFKDNIGLNNGLEYMDFLKLSGGEEESIVRVSGLADSSLANPKMLKQQIIEYMKYRAPINGGLSLLDCMASLKKIKKQSTVLDTKIKVDQENASFSEACKSYWEEIKEYEKKANDIDINAWKNEYNSIKEEIKQAARLHEQVKKLKKNYKDSYQNEFVFKKEYRTDIFDIFDDQKDRKFKTAYKELLNGKNWLTMSYEDASKVLQDAVDNLKENLNSLHQLTKYSWNTDGSLTASDVQVVNDLAEQVKNNARNRKLYMERLRQVCSLHSQMKKKFSDKKTEIDEVMKPLKENRRYDAFVASLADVEKISDDMLSKTQGRIDYASSWYETHISQVEDLKKQIEKTIKKGKKVVSSASDVNEQNAAFKTAIGNYEAEGSDNFSSEMNQVYKSNKNSFDAKKVKELNKQFEGFKTSAEGILTILDNGTYAEKKLKDKVPNSYGAFEAFISAHSSAQGIVSLSDFPKTELKKPEGDFYQYLKSTYGNKEESKEDKKNKDKVVEQANKLMKDNGQAKDTLSASVSDTDSLPSKGKGSESNKNDTPALKTGFTNFLGTISGIFSSIEDLFIDTGDGLTSIRDDLYITNYAINNFSYYTQEKEFEKDKKNITEEDKKPKTFSGIEINAATNQMYRGEVEYMLYGHSSVKENVDIAKGQIFAIRMAVNTAFTLTDSQINRLTGTIASAAAFIVPPIVVRVLLDVALAGAESALDIARMENGDKVELFKSSDTFICNPTNARNLAGVIKVLSESMLDETKHKMEGAANDLIDNTMENVQISVYDYVSDISSGMKTTLNEQMSSLTEGTRNRLQGAIDKALQKSVNPNDLKEVLRKEIAEVKKDVLNSLNGMSSLKGLGGIEEGIEDIFSSFENQLLSMIDTIDINNLGKELIEKGNELISENIGLFMRKIETKINNKVSSTIQELTAKIKNEVGDTIDTAVDGVREKVLGWTDSAFDKVLPDGKGKLSAGNGTGKKNNAFKNALVMGYSDYLQLFFYGQLNNKEENVLLRMADVIQMNLRKAGKEGSESAISKFHSSSNFLMKEAYTYTDLQTDLGMKTIFIGMDWFKKKSGKQKSGYDFSFETILGYS